MIIINIFLKKRVLGILLINLIVLKISNLTYFIQKKVFIVVDILTKTL